MNRHVQTLVASAVTLAACFLGTSTATAQLPEAGRKVLAYYDGTWEYEYEVEGEKYSGTWSVKWSPDKSCLLSDYTGRGPDGPSKGTKIIGWDTAKSQIVDLEFSANGQHFLARYTIKSDQVVSGKGMGSTADGKPSSSKLRVDKERDMFTWTVSDKVEGDKKLPDQVIVFRKVGDKK